VSTRSRTTYVIRRALPSDGLAVRRFVFATLEAYGVVPDPEGHDKDVMSFGSHEDPVDAFVADVEGTVVGSVMISPHGNDVGWLSKFFVDEGHRGAGIGRALLARAVDAGRKRSYRRLELDTRTFFKEAVHLYESTGWKRTADPPELGPCDAIYCLDLDERAPHGG
jgi:GNAT superfamily N-acetyltransferase